MLLHHFMEQYREEILARSAATIANRPGPSVQEDGVPRGLMVFYDQVIDTLRRAEIEPPPDAPPALVPWPPTLIGEAAALYGTELHRLGFNLVQVVHVYGTICEAVTRVAQQVHQPIGVSDFNRFNRSLDDAIAQAVRQVEHDHEESAASHEVERLGFLAHELRNAVSTAMMALHLIKEGEIGVRGQTGQVLERSLVRMRDLIDRSLTEVRLRTDALPQREPVRLLDVVTEIEVTAMGEAHGRGVKIDIEVEPGLTLEADRHMLVSAIANLVQNGLKFTRPGGTLSLRAALTGDRIAIEVEDECGGLAPGRAEELSRPSTRGTTDRSGIGLGLAIAHQAAQLHSGTIQVRNLPGKGCVFTIDLPIHAPGTPLLAD